MFGRLRSLSSAGRPRLLAATALWRALLLVLVLFGATGLAGAAENPSGLPLPRFATTRSTPINVRVGPGVKYDVAWVYKIAGTPVEIVQEFDTWRKIRDFDGSEGWVHQNLLSGARAGLVAPWGKPGDRIALRSGDGEDAGINAWVGPGFPVKISKCDGTWCEVTATDHPPGGRPANYHGFVPQAQLWGAYAGEAFD